MVDREAKVRKSLERALNFEISLRKPLGQLNGETRVWAAESFHSWDFTDPMYPLSTAIEGGVDRASKDRGERQWM